jgi:hypothetical protein
MSLNFAETISAVTFGNGVVRIHFVNRDDKSQALSKNGENPDNNKLDYSHTTVMPLSGFLYMASIISGLINDPKMQDQIKKYVEAGLLPGKAEDTNQVNKEEKGRKN